MRNVARIKLGYYPLPTSDGTRLRRLLRFPDEPCSVLDPCVGTGAALHQITHGSAARLYGVELDAERARRARESAIETIQGNLFDVHSKPARFSLLYLNPPYDSEVGSHHNKRMEFLFLERTFRWLVKDGMLVFVVPHARLEDCLSLLAASFADFRVLRLTDPEAVRFDQVVLFARRERVKASDVELNRQRLIHLVWKSPLAELSGEGFPYDVPPSQPAELVYRGLPLDQIEDLELDSAAWKNVCPFLLPTDQRDFGRPITPLHGGHVGLLCTAGLLNGIFGQGAERHYARWRTVKYVTTFTEEFDTYTEVHRRERFSNEVALIYADGRTKILTDEKPKKENGDAECTPEARAA